MALLDGSVVGTWGADTDTRGLCDFGHCCQQTFFDVVVLVLLVCFKAKGGCDLAVIGAVIPFLNCFWVYEVKGDCGVGVVDNQQHCLHILIEGVSGVWLVCE